MNYLIYPLKVMNITQTYNGSYTHKRHSEGNLKDYPIDDACGASDNAYFYCPCDEVIVKKIYGVGLKAANTIWLESTSEVITPTFKDYITIMVVHPEDEELKDIYVGKKYKRKERLFKKGADGNATGPHFHITIGRGKFTSGGWQKNSLGLWILKTSKYNIKPEQGFYIDSNFTNIKNTKGLEFIEVNLKNNLYYTISNLNIRYGPGEKFNFVNLLMKDTEVNVIEIKDGWAKLSDNQYVASNYLTKDKPSNYYKSKHTTAALLNVRNKPNGNIILYKIPKNTIVSVKTNKNNWTEIYKNRYVSTKYLK